MIVSLQAQKPANTQDDSARLVQRVIVISLDGARPDAILQANTPNLQRLANEGAVDWQAQTIYPPATIPAHASLLTGLTPEEHRVDWNSYSTEVLAIPTFLTLTYDAGYATAMVVGKEKFDQFHQRRGHPICLYAAGGSQCRG